MRILLRNSKTGLFYQDPDQVTENPQEAQVFEHTAQAISLVYEMKLRDMEVLLAFEDAAHNIRLPLQAFSEA